LSGAAEIVFDRTWRGSRTLRPCEDVAPALGRARIREGRRLGLGEADSPSKKFLQANGLV
jgi:hypothetical protein